MSRFSPQYHVACQIQKKILAKMGLSTQMANRVPQSSDADCDLSPKDLAVLTASWNTLEERKRILRNKPLVKAIDAPTKPKAVKPQTFIE